MPKIKILAVENDPTDAMLLARQLKDMASVDVAIDGDAFRELVKEPFDIILLDWNVPKLTGPEAIKIAKEYQPGTPVILVTGSLDFKTAVDALRLGMFDCHLKDELEKLPHSILQAMEFRQMKTREIRSQKDEVIASLSACVSHDVNNFLGTIIMGVEVLRDRKISPEKQLQVLDSMDLAAKKGASLVKSMTTFAKGANGALFKIASADSLLTEVDRMIRYVVESANVRLTIRAGKSTSSVRCDTVQIINILVNISLNGMQSMTPNGGDLFIEAKNVVLDDPPLEGNYVCISIRDTDGGIPDEILESIWTPYFSTKGAKGTGLGLARVKSILEAHNGGVRVKTGSNGTEFLIYLPVTQTTEVKTEEIFDGKGAVIVLADDEQTFRDLVKQSLEDANYKVLAACNGLEAMSFFRTEGKVDLLLSDIGLPHMSGVELLSALRAQGYSTPAVLMSGREFEAKLDPEPQAFIHKPFTHDSLLSTLRDVLSRV